MTLGYRSSISITSKRTGRNPKTRLQLAFSFFLIPDVLYYYYFEGFDREGFPNEIDRGFWSSSEPFDKAWDKDYLPTAQIVRRITYVVGTNRVKRLLVVQLTEDFLFTTGCLINAVCADTLSLSLSLSLCVNLPSIWCLQVLLTLPVLVVQDITCQKFPMLDTLERLSLYRPLFVN